jgi:DNA-binding MarR family transcriptional regulator
MAVMASSPDLSRTAGDLRIAVWRIFRRLRREWETGDLTAAELSMLARLEQDGPCGQAALAEAEQVTPPVVCRVVQGLQQQGLIQCDPDPGDGRRVILSVTWAGHAELTTRRSALSGRVAAVLADGFTSAERQQLTDIVPLLQRLAALL